MTQQKSNDELRKERTKRIEDAIALKVPDRVPIVPSFSYFPAKYAGFTCEDASFNQERWKEACAKTVKDFQPDMWNFAMSFAGPVMELLGNNQVKLPGHGISPHHSHQAVEAENMKADEYAAFLADPGDFTLRVFTPRVFDKLECFAKLPSLVRLVSGYGEIGTTELFTTQEFIDAFELLAEAGRKMKAWSAGTKAFGEEMKQLGFDGVYAASSIAPFDLISDNMRGMRGSMLDMYRHPDELIETCEVLLPMIVDRSITAARRTGNPRVFIPMHRGADGFMSIKQFEKFYWPTLKKLMMSLIDAELTPAPFFEGDYTSRLEYLLELPKGKVVGQFDSTDLFKAKEILGGHMCIRGNMPVSLLQVGSPEEVKDYAEKLIDVVGKDGGYIMGSRSTLDEADPKLLKVWIDFTKEYGVYR
jgi:hypothetical protein